MKRMMKKRKGKGKKNTKETTEDDDEDDKQDKEEDVEDKEEEDEEDKELGRRHRRQARRRRGRRGRRIRTSYMNMYKTMSQMDAIYYLPSVVMLQNANNAILGLIEDSQYLPLVASSSLILISLQDSAASSGMEPSGTN